MVEEAHRRRSTSLPKLVAVSSPLSGQWSQGEAAVLVGDCGEWKSRELFVKRYGGVLLSRLISSLTTTWLKAGCRHPGRGVLPCWGCWLWRNWWKYPGWEELDRKFEGLSVHNQGYQGVSWCLVACRWPLMRMTYWKQAEIIQWPAPANLPQISL